MLLPVDWSLRVMTSVSLTLGAAPSWGASHSVPGAPFPLECVELVQLSLQRVRHDLATEQEQQQEEGSPALSWRASSSTWEKERQDGDKRSRHPEEYEGSNGDFK